MEIKKFDLEDRLVKFACTCLTICDFLPDISAGKKLKYQLSKSGTAPALLYGEAQAAESRADFIHKMKIALKELRESKVNLRIIIEKPLVAENKISKAFKEANELIAIFTLSVKTAKKNYPN